MRDGQTLINEARMFAAAAHDGQFRKGERTPYIEHPVSVGRLLQQHGCAPHVVAAGLLHDTVEDTAVTADDIEQRFGPQVRRIVEEASEPDKSLPWKERKLQTIHSLAHKSVDAKHVIAADKLDNVRGIASGIEREGPAVWKRFNAPKSDQEWYYRGVCEALTRGSHPLFAELAEAVEDVFGAPLLASR